MSLAAPEAAGPVHTLVASGPSSVAREEGKSKTLRRRGGR